MRAGKLGFRHQAMLRLVRKYSFYTRIAELYLKHANLPLARTAYAVNVTVDLLGEDRSEVTGVECYAFPYQWVEDRWVFTQFQLVY